MSEITRAAAPANLTQIEQLVLQCQASKMPPISRWQPQQSMDIGLRIAADGQWYYQDSPIVRSRLVKLFASLLRRETGDLYYLVTPHIQYPVTVDDAPFQAVQLHRQGVGKHQKLIFRTNVDDFVLADRDHPIRIKTTIMPAQTIPYVEVRNGLQAKICRSVYYELAQILVPNEAQKEAQSHIADSKPTTTPPQIFGVYSARQFFPFGALD